VFIYLILLIILISGWLWFNSTKDKINNESQKMSFLLKEFNYLIDSKIEIFEEGLVKSKKIKYETIEIIISKPRKIKKDKWKVLMKIEHPDFFDFMNSHKDIDHVEIYTISDIRLEKIINTEEKFNYTIKSTKKTERGRTILSSDYTVKKEVSFDNNYPEGHPLRKSN
tara:strand:+ start:357 stop:860 length:504 start_codon:yes stop_codon:yes gene_type:complete